MLSSRFATLSICISDPVISCTIDMYQTVLHCIVSRRVVILSSGHKHADLFPCLPWGGIAICYHIQVPDRLICWSQKQKSGIWTLVSASSLVFVRFSDCDGGFSWAGPLPPLGRIITSLGAQHPFGAFSNAPICNQGDSLGNFWLWEKIPNG